MSWVERQRSFLDFTLSAFLRRKGKNISLLLVYGFMVFLISSVMFFTNALRYEAEAILQDSPEMIVQRTMAGRQALVPLRYAKEIQKIRGARRVKPRLWGYYYHPAAQANYTLMARDDYSSGEGTGKGGSGRSQNLGDRSGRPALFQGI